MYENIDELTLTRNNILCRIVVEASKAGIILSEVAKENAKHKLVALKVGPLVESVMIDDEVIVNPYEAINNRVKLSDDLIIISEDSVVCVKG